MRVGFGLLTLMLFPSFIDTALMLPDFIASGNHRKDQDSELIAAGNHLKKGQNSEAVRYPYKYFIMRICGSLKGECRIVLGRDRMLLFIGWFRGFPYCGCDHPLFEYIKKLHLKKIRMICHCLVYSKAAAELNSPSIQ